MTERRALVRYSVLLGAAALALTACTGQRDTAPAGVRPWRDAGETVRANATRVLADTGMHTGTGASVPVPATARGTQVVAITCRGHGTLTVTAGHAGTYRLPCSGTGEDELEEYAAAGPVPAGTLRVAPVAGLTWQVAVGWSPPGRRRPVSSRAPGAYPTTRTADPDPYPGNRTTPYPSHRPVYTTDPGDDPEPTHTTVHRTPPPVHHTTAPRPTRRHR